MVRPRYRVEYRKDLVGESLSRGDDDVVVRQLGRGGVRVQQQPRVAAEQGEGSVVQQAVPCGSH